jgi:hypothetical protein
VDLVIETVLQCNQRRRDEFCPLNGFETESDVGSAVDLRATSDSGAPLSPISVDLDVYRTLLYLAKYQCTSAFHAFFPATAKPCKGSHFWCAMGTPLPLFDRLVREGMHRYHHPTSNKDQSGGGTLTPMRDVADVALGFRCVFGHLI